MRAAVYSGTRNLYQDMMTASKSLLQHSNVEKIYFLIEDDIFPYQLPSQIQCINISNQTYFPNTGPNFKNCLTYMVLIRAAYTKIFPSLDKILTIDVDTIVNENISQLWDLDLTNYYLAAVEETQLTIEEGSYINMGVAMLNLKKIRQDKKDDQLIYNLNNFWYRFCQQDCFNEIFRGKIFILPSDYNCCYQAAPPRHEKITHFANIYNLQDFPHFNHYKNLSFSEIKRNLNDKFDLDIIIPTYKDKEGLRRTLNSIPHHSLVNIIVIDDFSELDYTDILQQYPYISLYQLSQNSGPGIARQFGIKEGHGSYITFIDSGDYFYENGVENILNQIQNNTYIKMYNWASVFTKGNILMDDSNDKTIGKTYKRSFIEMYNICFSEEESYANEDYGFSRACKIILKQLQRYHFHEAHALIKIPIFYEFYNPNSLTKANNNQFFYKKMIRGISRNAMHSIKITEKFKIHPSIIIDQISYAMAQLYYIFICTIYNHQQLLIEDWNNIKYFYQNCFRKYLKFSQQAIKFYNNNFVLPSIKNILENSQDEIPFNINQFIFDLEHEKNLPLKYIIR